MNNSCAIYLALLVSHFYSIGGSSVLSVQIFLNIAQGITLYDFFVTAREYIPSQERAFNRIGTTHGCAQVIQNYLPESSSDFIRAPVNSPWNVGDQLFPCPLWRCTNTLPALCFIICSFCCFLTEEGNSLVIDF